MNTKNLSIPNMWLGFVVILPKEVSGQEGEEEGEERGAGRMDGKGRGNGDKLEVGDQSIIIIIPRVDESSIQGFSCNYC